ncbi:PAS domain-containing protein [Pimelobacter simplex]|uniref:histidine kinase n=1 Tax=Nocardioides simplex TaxID=2045 RepID=A0A0A1DID4_NOCSI|nr:PAS domain-containing sensor histidine kinase [Pimelobacter simplex]AIY17034.1 Serine phosphatase RsbU, regulator of sigma subunit [Pimelobacter simplex]MCG8154578.1 PAS domain-containing protein [Pimelobacter simplex]GEB12979.1 histidine kinase [Pimelobacter simplex]SFM51344.1 histidine kinase [Pimelobacter simplex]
MPSLSAIARRHTDLDEGDIAWIQLIQADWQVIADLSFADLVLWLPDRGGKGFWVGDQMRPTTGPTAYVDDIVGTFSPAGRRTLVDAAFELGRIAREGDPEWRDEVPVRVEAIPVRRNGRVIAVISRNTNLLGIRTPSHLEINYLQAASDLANMIASGYFPTEAQRSDHADSPRVGDGFLRVDAEGRVIYASPNALSVYRKLGLTGDLTGHRLTDLTRDLVAPKKRPDEETLSAVLGGRAHRDTELGASSVGGPGDGAALIVRAIPLRPKGEHIGAIILLRDVTDLRRRDRELVTKDATIREIHHRVKNNLQTVAALLRLQARRIGSPEAASALEEAVRRVGSIAIVHETLSQAVEETVAFDDIADRLARLVTDVGSTTAQVRVRREGSFGVLVSEVATPLAMVVMELMQNAAEHGYDGGGSGEIVVRAARHGAVLEVAVEDDGCGLPDGFDLDAATSLGLSIVRTLVESELGGHLTLGPAPDHGTRASFSLPVD